MMEQSSVFHSLLHVIQLYGLIFASWDNEPLAGCHSGDGRCMGVMGEVGLGGPVLHDNRTHTRTEKNKWRLYLISQMKPLNWLLLNKTYCSPTYFAISFYSVAEGNLLVAPSNQPQYSCHAVACSNSKLSCSQLVRLVWFSFLFSLKIDKDTYWQHKNILIRTKSNKFERIYLLKKASNYRMWLRRLRKGLLPSIWFSK